METYLINLQRCPDRLEKMKQALNAIGVSFERVEAVDSKNLTNIDFMACETPNFTFPYELRKGEIACFLSHKICWQKLIDSGDQWALILEDHCIVSPKAKQYLQSTTWIPNECQIVQFVFSEKPIFYKKEIRLADGNRLLNTIYTSPIGTSGYFISKQAARLALKHSNKILSPIDNYLFGQWSEYPKLINTWRLCGAIIKRDPELETTIKNRVKKKRRIYPLRYFIKVAINIQCIFLKKAFQYWY